MRVKLTQLSMAHDDMGSRAPVLFIHGYPLNRRMWQPQMDDLWDVARLLAVDLRGHGESEAPPGPYSMDALADDCAEFLEAMRVRQPVVVCGLSMGGYVAMAFYRRHRARVGGLIFTATRAAADSEAARAARNTAIVTAQTHGVAAIAESMLPKLFAPATYDHNPALVARVKAMMLQTALAGVLGVLPALRDRADSTPMLPEIAVPTLVIHGEADAIVPLAEAQAMHAAIPNARLAIVPQAGHLPNLEQPARFNAAVRDFLETL